MNINNLFIVFSSQRSGSHYLKELLGSHKRIDCAGEILNTRKAKIDSERAGVFFQFIAKDFQGIYKNREKYLEQGPNHHYSCGCIVHDRHLENPVVRKFFEKDHNFRFILLYRRNQLARYVSYKTGKITGQYFVKRADHITKPKQYHYDPQEALDYIEKGFDSHQRVRKFLTDHDHDFITVTYEDLVTDRQHQMERVYDYLQVGYSDPTTRSIKQNTQSIKEKMVNSEEFIRVISRSRYKHMLDNLV